MTAAARQPRFAQGVDERPDAEFIAVRKAARLLGRNEASLRRECASKLAGTGMARQVRSAAGQLSWHVHRSFDPRLIARDDEAADDATADILLHATSDQRDRAAARAKVLNAYRELVASGATVAKVIGQFIARQRDETGVDRLSYRQLREWAREAPPADQPRRLLAFFIDRRGGDQRSTEASGRGCHPEAWAEFERVYLHRNRWSIAKAHRHVQTLAKSNGWQWPSLRHVQRRASQIIDPSRECMARDGMDIWRSKFGYKLQQHPDAWGAGEMWIGDHSRLDFFARRRIQGEWKAVRLWVTAWLDWRTRKILGWWIDDTPSADTIRYAMHAAIKSEGGPPRRVTIDNGKDYASYANVGLTKIQRRDLVSRGEDWAAACQGLGLFGMLGIETHFAAPYNHDGKSRIERFFGTMHGEFCKTFDSYCGARPGDVELPAWVSKDPQRLVGIDEVRSRFAEFARWYNDRCDHGMEDLADENNRRLSPAEAMSAWRQTRTIMPRPEALALLMHRWEQPRTVGKLGIGVRIAGRTMYYGQDAIELRPLQGRKAAVHVTYEPDDMSRIFVYDEQFRFICTARANGMHGGNGPASRAAIASAVKRKREHERSVRQTLRDGHMSLMTAVDIAQDEQRQIDADRRAERAREGIGVENDNQQLRIVRTPVDEASTEVERAEMRQAAGAETLPPDEQFELPILEAPRREDDGDDDLTFNICDALESAADSEEEDFDIWEGLTQ